MNSTDAVVKEEIEEQSSDQDPAPVLEREVRPPSHPRPNIQPGKLADAKAYRDNLGNVKFDPMHPDDLLELRLEGVTNPHQKLEIINLHNREMISMRIAEAQHTGIRFNTPNGALRSFVNETDARYLISNIIPKPTQEERPAEDPPNIVVPSIHREPPPPRPRVIPKTTPAPAKPTSMLLTPMIPAPPIRTKSRPVPEVNPVINANVNKLLMQATVEMQLQEEEKNQPKAPSGSQRRSRKSNHPQKIQNGVEEEEPAPAPAPVARPPVRAPIPEQRVPAVHTPIQTPNRVQMQPSILAPLRTPPGNVSPVSNYSHCSVSVEFGDDQGHGSGRDDDLESSSSESFEDHFEISAEDEERFTISPSADTTVVNKDTKQADEYIDETPVDKPKDGPSSWSNPTAPQKPEEVVSAEKEAQKSMIAPPTSPQSETSSTVSEEIPPVDSPAPSPAPTPAASSSARDSTSRASADVSVKGAESEDNHQNADTSTDMNTTDKMKTPRRRQKTDDTSNRPVKRRLTEADRLMNMDFGPKEGGKLGELDVVWSADKRRRTTQPAPEPPARKVLPRRGAEKKKVIDNVDDEEMEEEEEEREKKEEDKNTPGTSSSSGKVTRKRGRKSLADGNAAKSAKRSGSKNEDREGEKDSPVEKETAQSAQKSERTEGSIEDGAAPVLTPVQRSPEPKSPPTEQSTPRKYQAKMFEIAPATPQSGSDTNPIVVPEDTPEASRSSEPVRSSPTGSPSGPTTSSIQVVKVHHINQPKVVPNLLPVQTIPQVHHGQPTPVARRSNPQPAVMNIPPFQVAPPHNNSPHNGSSVSVQQAIRAQQGIPPRRPPTYPVAQAQRHPIAPYPQSSHHQQPNSAQQQFLQRQQVHPAQQQYQQQQQQQLQQQQQQQQQQLQQHIEQQQHLQQHIQNQQEQQRLEQLRLDHQRRRAPQQQQQRRPNPPRPTHNGIPPHLARPPVIPIPEPARPVIPIEEPVPPVILTEPVRPTEPVLLTEDINRFLLYIPPTCDHNYSNWTPADVSAWMKGLLKLNDADPMLRKVIEEEIGGWALEEFLKDGSFGVTTLGLNAGRTIGIKSGVIKVINNFSKKQYEIDMAEYNQQMRLYEIQQRENRRN